MSREPFIVSEDKSLEVTFREVRDFEEYKDLTFETDPSTSDVKDRQDNADLENNDNEGAEEAAETSPDDTWEDQFFIDEPYFGSSFEVKEEAPAESGFDTQAEAENDDADNGEEAGHEDEEASEGEEPATAEEWVVSDLSADDNDETPTVEPVVDEEVATDPVAAEKEFADEETEPEEDFTSDEPDPETSEEETVSAPEESSVVPEPFGSFIVEAGEESQPVTVEAEPAWEDDSWDDDSDESDDEKASEGSFSEELSQANVTALILGQVSDVETYSLGDADEESDGESPEDNVEEGSEIDTFEAITTEDESLNKADTVEELEPEYSDLGQPDTIALAEGEVPNFDDVPQLGTTSDDSQEEAEEMELDLSDED